MDADREFTNSSRTKKREKKKKEHWKLYEFVITPGCDFPPNDFFGKTKRKAVLINVIIYLHVCDYIDVSSFWWEYAEKSLS